MLITIKLPGNPALLGALCEGVVLVNLDLLARSPLPSLYASGVVYRPEPVPKEEWLTCAQVYQRGVGDCEDVANWRTAELRRDGEDAETIIIPSNIKRRRGRVWHAVTLRGDGRIEDPSRVLRWLERERRA